MSNPDPMAQIRALFFVECEELLESLQDALNVLDSGAGDTETINVVFRAVHSIKGGAGAFSLTALVAFAHRFETVMDEVRSGRMAISAEALKLFFQAADMLADEVRAARDGTTEPGGAESTLLALEALMGGTGAAALAEPEPDFTPMEISLSLDFGLPGPSEASGSIDPDEPARMQEADWIVRFRPARGLYASGNEPLLILRALAGLGAAVVTCHAQDVPAIGEFDPEAAYLAWTVQLPGTLAEADILEVFDFVLDVADISVARADGLGQKSSLGASDVDASPPLAFHEPHMAKAVPDRSVANDQAFPLPRAEPLAPAPLHLAMDSDALSSSAAPAAGTPAAIQVAAVAAPPAPEANSPTVRVDLDRIDRLVNLVGELVITQAMLAQSVAEVGLPTNSPVMSGLESFMMLTRDIQDSVMMIRAQPVKPLFQRMARIVREASIGVGKDVRLRTDGETTEVDKTVIERLADPLTHMIRNAVDHGLEATADRIAAGKPAEGVVTLTAQHRSGRVVIEIADDGAGINRPRVQEIAVSRGLIPADVQLSDAEIDNLLFLPGFSTAATISNLSGRGVGMDVVKRAIQSLGGRIAITSERGKGTRFSISLPLTLAVLDGMVVRVAGETLVVPLSAIVETATLTEAEVRVVGPGSHVIHIRGEFVPLYDLSVALGFRAAATPSGIVLLTATEQGSRAALMVDEILEQRQVVIKGLQQSYGHVPGIAAATILGDGQIALILDPADLVQTATGRGRSSELALAG